MKIAIIGAGFCGLAAAWHLLNLPNVSITLYDQTGIGGGASGIAAGLLHPFAGAHAKLNWKGLEGMAATEELLDAAAAALGRVVIAPDRGILRPALTSLQIDDFKKCAQNYPNEADWLENKECQKRIPGSVNAPGLWIKRGVTVYCSLYLEGLWKDCLTRGMKFVQKRIDRLDEMDHFDLTILTAGSGCTYFPELSALPLNKIKGQVLELAWPSHLAPLPYPLNSQIYMVMTEKGNSCFVGATYERNYQQEELIDSDFAQKELLPKAYQLFPGLQNAPIIGCCTGIRLSAPQHHPIVQQLTPSLWTITGMGSKGLLYHALCAKKLLHLLKTKRE